MAYGNYPSLEHVKRALVIKLRHHGDVLLTSPVFSALKNVLEPDAQIDAYIYQDTLPMLEGHPAISHFHTYDKKWKKLSYFRRLIQELKLLRKIRSCNYDLIINLTEGDSGAVVAKVSGASICVGVDPGKDGMRGKKKCFTHIVKNCPSPRHAVERNLDALRRIGIFPSVEEREVTLQIPKEEKEKIAITDYVVVHPVSRWKFKCPPTTFTADLIAALHAQDEKIVLTSSPDPEEMAMCREIMGRVPHVPIIDMAGKTSLKGLAALIAKAKGLITVDSVPLHIASATKTPVVALFGPTSERNWGPWMHPQAKVVAADLPCRPCFLDGCGGSKKSDCLYVLRVKEVLEAFESVQSLKSSPR